MNKIEFFYNIFQLNYLIMEKFIARDPISVDIQQLFNVAVFYNKVEDVKYLLENYRQRIDVNHAGCNIWQTSISMFKAIVDVVKIGKVKIGKVNDYIHSKFIPIIIENYSGTFTEQVYKKFIDIALESNDKDTIKYLLSKIDMVKNDYVHVILLCASGENEKLEKYLNIVIEMGDECYETAYLCGNFDTIKFLWNKEIRMHNCFLKEKIICDPSLLFFDKNLISDMHICG